MSDDATPAQDALDLDTVAQADSAVLVVKHPVTGADTPARITIAGPEHAVRKAMVFARMRAARREFEKTGNFRSTDPVDDEQDENELLAACTLGWSGLTVAGEPVLHSTAVARGLYADPRRRWLRDQVKAALDQRELFINGSATA